MNSPCPDCHQISAAHEDDRVCMMNLLSAYTFTAVRLEATRSVNSVCNANGHNTRAIKNRAQILDKLFACQEVVYQVCMPIKVRTYRRNDTAIST